MFFVVVCMFLNLLRVWIMLFIDVLCSGIQNSVLNLLRVWIMLFIYVLCSGIQNSVFNLLRVWISVTYRTSLLTIRLLSMARLQKGE